MTATKMVFSSLVTQSHKFMTEFLIYDTLVNFFSFFLFIKQKKKKSIFQSLFILRV